MDFLKLPSRAFMFAQMKFFARRVEKEDADVFCGAHQEDCGFQTQFPADAKLLQWSWVGEQPVVNYTTEGMSVASLLTSIILLPIILLLRPKQAKITKAR